MKTFFLILDIVVILISLVYVISGQGKQGDYFEVFGFLFLCLLALIKWKYGNKRSDP